MQDLRDLFRVEPEELRSSITQKQLHELHGGQRKSSAALEQVLSDLQSLPGFAGTATIPYYDLLKAMFSFHVNNLSLYILAGLDHSGIADRSKRLEQTCLPRQ